MSQLMRDFQKTLTLSRAGSLVFSKWRRLGDLGVFVKLFFSTSYFTKNDTRKKDSQLEPPQRSVTFVLSNSHLPLFGRVTPL